MKTIAAILILISNLTVIAQTDKIAGDYTIKFGDEVSALFKYQLILNQDGTFFLHYYSNIKIGIPPEINKYGKGNWTEANKVISFFSDKQKDLDEKHTLDVTNTKARFIIKSPRDKTDKVIKTSLQFLESELPWLGKINMLKV
jgi:hypothetical protein